MSANPYSSPSARIADLKLRNEITWGQALPVWWSVVWRGFIYGLAGGFALGFIGGFIAALIGAPEKAALWGTIGGYIAGIPASMLAVKQAMSKHLLSLVRIADHV